MIQCPRCNGTREILAAHVTYTDGTSGYGVPFPCIQCNGTGEIPEEMLEWLKQGKIMRDKRVNGFPYRTLQEESYRRSMTLMTLSAMEQGRIKPILEE